VGSRSQATGLNFRASPRASVVVETCQVELQVKAVDHSRVPPWESKGSHMASGYHHGVLTCHLVLLENAGLVGLSKNYSNPKPSHSH